VAHRDDHAHDRGHDTEAGQRFRDLAHRAGDQVRLGVLRLELGFEQRVQVVAGHAAQRHHAQVIDDELHRAVNLVDCRTC
jgi:hypothetical protein